MIKYKDEADIKFQNGQSKIHPDIILAMAEISKIYHELEGKDLIITAVIDDEAEEVQHHDGRAFDARTKNLSNPFLATDIIKKRLNEKYPGRYRIIYKNHAKPNAHLHCQLSF